MNREKQQKQVKVRRGKNEVVSDTEPFDLQTCKTQLQTIVERELPLLEQAIRKFQSEVSAISTDAGYEVKVAADYFCLDVRSGILIKLRCQMESPEYRPDPFRADVLAGRVADRELILLPDEKPKPKSEGRPKVAAETPLNISEPIGSRN